MGEEAAAAVSAAVLESAGAAVAAGATTTDACGRERGTPAPAIRMAPTQGVAAGGGRAHAHRPSASSWGSWEAGAYAGSLAATSCLAPEVGPAARAMTAPAGTVLGVGYRGRPSVLAGHGSERASLVASGREMVVMVVVAVVVEQTR